MPSLGQAPSFSRTWGCWGWHRQGLWVPGLASTLCNCATSTVPSAPCSGWGEAAPWELGRVWMCGCPAVEHWAADLEPVEHHVGLVDALPQVHQGSQGLFPRWNQGIFLALALAVCTFPIRCRN